MTREINAGYINLSLKITWFYFGNIEDMCGGFFEFLKNCHFVKLFCPE